MGAWSHEPFGNDTANDWAYGLEDVRDLSYVEEAFDRVLGIGDDYLDASDAEEAVAAAEVLAKLLGKGTQSDSYTQKVELWTQGVATKPTPELRKKASQALQRIAAQDSELRELWNESDQASDWLQSIEQLQTVIAA